MFRGDDAVAKEYSPLQPVSTPNREKESSSAAVGWPGALTTLSTPKQAVAGDMTHPTPYGATVVSESTSGQPTYGVRKDFLVDTYSSLQRIQNCRQRVERLRRIPTQICTVRPEPPLPDFHHHITGDLFPIA